eukprot:NODE_327_length_9598_cov_1.179914.p2 type:complete len:354 gc:universal NODE_327_length_9598_cov_1.179914:5915-4854(-)
MLVFLFYGCHSYDEASHLSHDNVKLHKPSEKSLYLSIKLTWHKTMGKKINGNGAQLNAAFSPRNFYDHPNGHPILPVTFFRNYMDFLKSLEIPLTRHSFLFCDFHISPTGKLTLDATKSLSFTKFKDVISMLQQDNSLIPRSIGGHSYRRGGARWILFQSNMNMDIESAMKWGRWESPATFTKYILQLEISRHKDISDVMNPLRLTSQLDKQGILFINYKEMAKQVVDLLKHELGHFTSKQRPLPLPISQAASIQTCIDIKSVTFKSFPSISKVMKYFFKLWKEGDPQTCPIPIKDHVVEMYKVNSPDRHAFKEKVIVGQHFNKFPTFEQFKSRYPSLKTYRSARDYFRKNDE